MTFLVAILVIMIYAKEPKVAVARLLSTYLIMVYSAQKSRITVIKSFFLKYFKQK